MMNQQTLNDITQQLNNKGEELQLQQEYQETVAQKNTLQENNDSLQND